MHQDDLESIQIYLNRDRTIIDEMPMPLHAAWKMVIDNCKSRRKKSKMQPTNTIFAKHESGNSYVVTEPT